MAAERSKNSSKVKKEVVKTGKEQRVHLWTCPVLTSEPAEVEAALVLHNIRQEKERATSSEGTKQNFAYMSNLLLLQASVWSSPTDSMY